jgi:hypothetical protein
MITNRKADRALLTTLKERLSVSHGRLKRDLCGDWTITGTRGHFLSDGVNAFAYIPAGTARRWEKAKGMLDFMTVTNDGDDEGILKLAEMPTAPQAEALRKLLGLRKATPLTDEGRAELRSRFKSPSQGADSAPFIASGRVTLANPQPDSQTAKMAA